MIGELLKEKRVENKLTQKQLAEKAGVSFVCINRIEKGQLPRVGILVKLFDAMNCKLTFIVEPKQSWQEVIAQHEIDPASKIL